MPALPCDADYLAEALAAARAALPPEGAWRPVTWAQSRHAGGRLWRLAAVAGLAHADRLHLTWHCTRCWRHQRRTGR